MDKNSRSFFSGQNAANLVPEPIYVPVNNYIEPEPPEAPQPLEPTHVTPDSDSMPEDPKQPWYKKIAGKLTKKQWTIVGIVALLLIVGGVIFALTRPHAAKPAAKVAEQPPAPVIITSPLTGRVVSAADAKRPVTGVMIENSDFARPQSGLKEAGVVFEGIAEAGITRFLALYQEAKPGNIGPVRSVRPYFLQWAMGFDAPLAHVGGSPEALQDMKNWRARDLDQFYNSAYYHRISTRFAPHNMYTSMANLDAAKKSHHWSSSSFTGFARKQADPAKVPTAKSIDFSISSADFSVHYKYDARRNAYKRFMAGAPHTDAKTGKQLEPDVVIALVIPYKLEGDGYHSDYDTIGSGKMYVFQDGAVTKGTWKKTGNKKQFEFTDKNGKAIELNPGQTWISAVDATNKVTYK
jgi:hypothetical protein